MKIAVIGAPGSGKTYLSKRIAESLNIPHIECDEIFWQGLNLRTVVDERTDSDNWILEGHIGKVHDIVFPKANKILVILGSDILSLVRATKRDWKNLNKAWFNIQFYHRLSTHRNQLIDQVKIERPQDILYLNNFPSLSASSLRDFCDGLKSKEDLGRSSS